MTRDWYSEKDLEAMTSAAAKAGVFTKVLDELQREGQCEIKIGWDSCGVPNLLKGDEVVVKRQGAHALHRGHILLFRFGKGLRFGRFLRVAIEKDGRYFDVLFQGKQTGTMRLTLGAVAGRVVEARRNGARVSLAWNLVDDVKARFRRQDKPFRDS